MLKAYEDGRQIEDDYCVIRNGLQVLSPSRFKLSTSIGCRDGQSFKISVEYMKINDLAE